MEKFHQIVYWREILLRVESLLFRQFIISDSFQSWFIKETQESYYRQIIVKDEAINTKTYIDIDIIKGNK